jgi:hypothetical protein
MCHMPCPSQSSRFDLICQLSNIHHIKNCRYLKLKLRDLIDICICHVYLVYDWLFLGTVFSCT